MRKLQLSQYEIQDLIERLKKGENIPEDYKYKLFHTKQKEYELVYGGKMRKEDILANEDGVFPVPLQTEKVFNGKRETWDDGWKNMIVFGDNLQFLKTIYENKDPLIKDKVKGKVKLIYIDPPFGTGDEYDGNKGQKGYSAKTKGAEFVEFLRRRLIVAREILADDGSIFVRLDYHFNNYIKIILDEVFDKGNFRNEIVVKRTRTLKGESKQFATATDTIYMYAKNKETMLFNGYRKLKPQNEWKWVDMHLPGTRKDKSLLYRRIFGKTVKAPEGRRWALSQEAFENAIGQGLVRWNEKKQMPEFLTKWETIGSNWTDISGYSKTIGYPTENAEELLERIIKSTTNEGDLVLDFFAGSGTTAAVAEKLNRKWITCDIGKLSFYTIQKRILNIDQSKDLENPKKKHGKPAKSFITVNTGHYDLEKVFKLSKEKYIDFVMDLFEVEPIKKTISGIKIDGERKDGYYALVWPYWDFKDALVDEEYLYNLHSNIGKKIGDRLYIIAPASYVDFISDYFEIDGVRYYFLKVPYHLIKELHKVYFKKFRQPQSKKNVNDLEDAIGFHFMKQPEVVSEIKTTKDEIKITVKKFYSDFSEDEKGREMENFESLAMVLIDKNFDGKAFDMDEYYFAEDLLPKKKKDEENIAEELKKSKVIELPLISKKECGETIMVIYVDIFGNEFKEEFKVK